MKSKHLHTEFWWRFANLEWTLVQIFPYIYFWLARNIVSHFWTSKWGIWTGPETLASCHLRILVEHQNPLVKWKIPEISFYMWCQFKRSNFNRVISSRQFQIDKKWFTNLHLYHFSFHSLSSSRVFIATAMVLLWYLPLIDASASS